MSALWISRRHSVRLTEAFGEMFTGNWALMIRVLQSVYESVRSCICYPDNLTQFLWLLLFQCPDGVRQGCVLSPMLFSFLFVNELALKIAQNGLYGIQLISDVVQVLIMLSADDVILTSYSTAGLQKQIDILKHFADIFSVTVNLNKTKSVVFRKAGFLAANEVWKYGDQNTAVVNSFKQLGLHFTTKQSLTQTVGELATKAKIRTSQLLRCLWRLNNVQRNVFFQMLCTDLSYLDIRIRAIGFSTVRSAGESAFVRM